MSNPVTWSHFSESFVRYEDLGLSLDVSRMNCPEAFFEAMSIRADQALADMDRLHHLLIITKRYQFIINKRVRITAIQPYKRLTAHFVIRPYQ